MRKRQDSWFGVVSRSLSGRMNLHVVCACQCLESLQEWVLLMKSRTDWWRALGGLNECDRLSAIATTGPCFCGAWAWVSGGPSLIAWLTAAAFYAHGDTHSSPSSKSPFKELPSLRQTEWYPCHLSLPMSEPQPGSGVIWCRHAPRASVRHCVTPHQAWLWPGLRSGLRAAPAVRCCKWLLELTDRSLAVPAVLSLHSRAA